MHYKNMKRLLYKCKMFGKQVIIWIDHSDRLLESIDGEIKEITGEPKYNIFKENNLW